jgi:hypothetical protein
MVISNISSDFNNSLEDSIANLIFPCNFFEHVKWEEKIQNQDFEDSQAP